MRNSLCALPTPPGGLTQLRKRFFDNHIDRLIPSKVLGELLLRFREYFISKQKTQIIR